MASSMSTTVGPKLPFDIFETILNLHICDLHRSEPEIRFQVITSLSTVSTTFWTICRPRIFEKVVCGIAGRRKERLLRFFDILNASPHLQQYIHTLTVDFSIHEDEATNVITQSDAESTIPVLCAFPNVSDLIITSHSDHPHSVVEQLEVYKASVVHAHLSRSALRSLSLTPFPQQLLHQSVISCAGLQKLQIHEPPFKWTHFNQSSTSNITQLSISAWRNDNFDLSLLDHCPQLEYLDLSLTASISSRPAHDRYLLPSFNLNTLIFSCDTRDNPDNPLRLLVDFFRGPALREGVLAFSRLEHFSASISIEDDIAPVFQILDEATGLRSLSLDASESYSLDLFISAALELPRRIRYHFHSLESIHLWILLPTQNPNIENDFMNDLIELFTSISGHNRLKFIGISPHANVAGLPTTLAPPLIPLARILSHPGAYPQLEKVHISYMLILHYDPNSAVPWSRNFNATFNLEETMKGAMRDVIEMGVRLEVVVDEC